MVLLLLLLLLLLLCREESCFELFVVLQDCFSNVKRKAVDPLCLFWGLLFFVVVFCCVVVLIFFSVSFFFVCIFFFLSFVCICCFGGLKIGLERAILKGKNNKDKENK